MASGLLICSTLCVPEGQRTRRAVEGGGTRGDVVQAVNRRIAAAGVRVESESAADSDGR
jgi:hypothetical protein